MNKEAVMTSNAIPEKVTRALEAARRDRMWGQIVLEMRDGKVDLLRKTTTEKVEPREIPHDEKSYR
jgi:hypothetical protein